MGAGCNSKTFLFPMPLPAASSSEGPAALAEAAPEDLVFDPAVCSASELHALFTKQAKGGESASVAIPRGGAEVISRLSFDFVYDSAEEALGAEALGALEVFSFGEALVFARPL